MMARLTRYSLRTLLVLLMVSGIVLAIYSNYARDFRDEQSALKTLTASANRVAKTIVEPNSNEVPQSGSVVSFTANSSSKPMVLF